ncbi:MAG: universal stress protein [Deltaproteobacteria bacterium]|nr:universal stress protein [Deltaproteobacteria bacterium]
MKILLPVSPGGSPGESLRLAIDTARALGGEIRALCIVDTEGIRRCESGAPPGAIHLARQAEERIAAREARDGEAALSEIRAACAEAGIPFSREVVKGDPRRELSKEGAMCDLLVAGRDAQFAYRGSDEPGEVVLALMKDRVLPLLLSAAPYRPVRTVAIGCGGGDRTARAVGAMARLSLWKSGCRIILLTVAGSGEEGETRMAGPRRILADAGYGPPEEKVVSGPKADRFAAACEEAGADAVVLGGWGEHRWDDVLGLSITGRLLEERRRHLFLYM